MTVTVTSIAPPPIGGLSVPTSDTSAWPVPWEIVEATRQLALSMIWENNNKANRRITSSKASDDPKRGARRRATAAKAFRCRLLRRPRCSSRSRTTGSGRMPGPQYSSNAQGLQPFDVHAVTITEYDNSVVAGQVNSVGTQIWAGNDISREDSGATYYNPAGAVEEAEAVCIIDTPPFPTVKSARSSQIMPTDAVT